MQEQTEHSSYFEIFPIQQNLKILFSEAQKFKCIKNNKAINICTEKYCLQPGLICGQQDCQCKNLHQDCKTKFLKKIISNLLNKKKDISKQIKINYNKLYKEINQLIDQLSILRQKIENQQQYFGLSNLDLKLIDIIRENKLEQINGKIIFQIQKSQSQNSQNQKLFVQFKQSISAFILQSLHQVTQIANIAQGDEKYIIFDPLNKKIYKEKSSWRLWQNVYWQAYKFIPLTVNQSTLNFSNEKFMMQDEKIFEKVGSMSEWNQAISNQSLPLEGKFYFQVNCHFTQSKSILIGIISENCIQNTYSNYLFESMCYYLEDGRLYSSGQRDKIGKSLKGNKGIINVMIDMENKTIHWCINGEYQGKANINKSLLFKNKKIFAEVQVLSQFDRNQFIS